MTEDLIEILKMHVCCYEVEEIEELVAGIKAAGVREARGEILEALPDSPSKAQTDRMKYAIGFMGAYADRIEGGEL